MPRLRLVIAWWAVASVLAASQPAAAQFNPEAEKLFRDGKALMKREKYAEACDAFESSQKLDPNIATLMSLADCREKNGQLVTSWGLFLQAESRAQGDGLDKLAETARKRSTALESRYSVLTIEVAPASRIAGLAITRDGKPIDAAGWNKALPLDGGSYVLSARAPGRKPWSKTVVVPNEWGKIEVTVPVLPAEGAVTPPPHEPPPKPVPPKVVPPPDKPVPLAPGPSDTGGGSSGMRRGAVTVGVLGLLLVAGGGFTGWQAKNLEKDADGECPPADCSLEAANRANHKNSQARTAALAANVLFVAGGVALITSGVLLIKSKPRRQSTALQVTPHVEPTYAGLDASFGF